MKLHSLFSAAALAVALLASSTFAADPKATAAPAPPATGEVATVHQATDLEPLRAAVGQIVTIEGMVMGNGESKSGTVRYLNFTKNFRESVGLVFFVSKGGEEFSAEKLGAWVGKKVRATGKVGDFNGALQITIEKWDQVKEVE